MDSLAPAVSIITPCHNAAKWLDAAIHSVREQDYHNWEMLIIDDASSDNSSSIASLHAEQDSRIQLHTNPRQQGGAEARNIGIRLARGHYIAFLDADDCWGKSKLATQVEFMEQASVAFCYTAYEKIHKDGARQRRFFYPPQVIQYQDLLKTCSIGCSTVMLDTKVLGKRLFPDIRRSHDYALWLDILRDGYIARGIDEPLTVYREHNESLSANKLLKLKMAWRIYREQESLSLFASGWALANYILHGIRKRLI
ncbi:MAG: glycosyltransferase [Desulfobulbaceae bacterium]|nr:glycosyltransferase [Desulfobulbaceae bacterium]